jgi:hypothetical protein
MSGDEGGDGGKRVLEPCRKEGGRGRVGVEEGEESGQDCPALLILIYISICT